MCTDLVLDDSQINITTVVVALLVFGCLKLKNTG